MESFANRLRKGRAAWIAGELRFRANGVLRPARTLPPGSTPRWFAAAAGAALLLAGCHAPAPQAAHTASGKPLGAPVSRTIGAAGGELASSDGRVRVIVPAGAFASPREVSLQPISNQAPGGRGSAWRLEPSGQPFGEPVTLAFHYDDKDVAGSAPQALAIASQDEKGRWSIARKPVLDTAAHSLSVAVDHFSDWSLLSGFQLDPAEATLKPGQSVTLRELYCTASTANENGPIALLPCEPASGDIGGAGDWQANGVAGGDADNGTVAAQGGFSAVYTAPQQAPARNPVAVSARLQGALADTRLVANIRVEDEGCGQHNGQRVPCRIDGSVASTSPLTRAKASGTWKFDYWAGDLAVYKAVAGRVDLLDLHNDPCTFTAAPSTHPLADGDNDNSLQLDFSVRPATFTPSGTSTWAGTLTPHCPPDWPQGGEPDPQITAIWGVPTGHSPLQADGTIQGSASQAGSGGAVSTTWNLRAQ